MNDQNLQYCTFLLDNFLFGIEVTQIQELLPAQRMVNVPLSPPTIKGLINLRGQIVTAIDMRKMLDLPELDSDRASMNVVLLDEGEAVSLLVDEIGEVMEVDERRFEAAPDTLRSNVRHLITGAYKLNDRLLLVLDVAKILDRPKASSDAA